MAVVVVAIPRQDDPVWDISSEKIPHMTLLYMDDDVGDTQRVTDYVEHAADTLSPFHMIVERRDVLGEDSADVLFFRKEESMVARLEDFRRQLLANNDIFRAYHMVEQFPQWTPHLTLGYPETPAKKVDGENSRIYMVEFDRIALWTGDFEGVEFPLTSHDGLAMMAENGKQFIAHYGVKGMHWGIRRGRSGAGKPAKPGSGHAPSEDAMTVKTLKDKGKNSGRDALTNRELQTLVTRWNLERQYEQTRPRGAGEQATKFVADLLLSIGKEQAQAQGRAHVNDLIKNSKK